MVILAVMTLLGSVMVLADIPPPWPAWLGGGGDRPRYHGKVPEPPRIPESPRAAKEEECRGKQPGDACRADGGAGVCVKTMCDRLDYSHGTPPGSTQVPCVLCTPPPADHGAASAAPKAP